MRWNLHAKALETSLCLTESFADMLCLAAVELCSAWTGEAPSPHKQSLFCRGHIFSSVRAAVMQQLHQGLIQASADGGSLLRPRDVADMD